MQRMSHSRLSCLNLKEAIKNKAMTNWVRYLLNLRDPNKKNKAKSINGWESKVKL